MVKFIQDLTIPDSLRSVLNNSDLLSNQTAIFKFFERDFLFPTTDNWASFAMKSLDQERINADVAGMPMHEILCALTKNMGLLILKG